MKIDRYACAFLVERSHIQTHEQTNNKYPDGRRQNDGTW